MIVNHSGFLARRHQVAIFSRRKESTIVMVFCQCFFDTPEVSRIVLQKVVPNSEDPKMYLLAQGTEPKKVSRVTYNTGRDQKVHL